MTTKLRIVLAQLNLTVGDIAGNLKKHIDAAIVARDKMAADVIVFPELGLCGYSPEDLLFRDYFIAEVNDALQKFISEIKGIHCVIGYPRATAEGLQNTCSLIFDGKILGTYAKQRLPNYGVFDERRYFTPGEQACVINIKGIPTGMIICEDVWKIAPAKQAAEAGAKLLLIPNASPFKTDKHEQRIIMLKHRSRHNHVVIAYVNNVGAQDDLVFDGGSAVFNADGKMCQFAGFFNETLLPFDVSLTDGKLQVDKAKITIPEQEDRIYKALVLAVRDYVNKNNIPGVLVGVSGGIDSALTLAIAVDALGKDRVQAVMMPSRYTADISHVDAVALIDALGMKSETISIEPAYKSFLETLAPQFAGKKADITEENIQARCRAVILMALSNKSGFMVLTTGNRSEIATGYCTLYGDMAGGFAPLKDVPKTMVYALANYRNTISHVIPQRTIERAPTAELAPDQKDEDSLPPYAILDQILELYLNHNMNVGEITAKGFDKDIVMKVVALVHKNEYKRRQGAIGPRINIKSFGRDWRYPLTNRYRG